MIHEEICTYEVCKLAKEKGFDWMPSMYFHSGVESDLRVVGVNGANPNKIPHSPHISCPTQSLLQRWLRKEKALHTQITLWEKGWYYDIWAFEYYEEEKEYSAKMLHQSSDFTTYELALEDALKYALENLV